MKHKFGFKQTFFVAMLAVAGVFGISSALVDKQVNETPTVEKAEATDDYNWYYNISLQGRTAKSGSWVTYSTSIHTNTNPHECYYENVASGVGFEILGFYNEGSSSGTGRWNKVIQSGGASSNFDNSGTDGNITCKTAGVYSYYFKYATDGVAADQRPTYISYGTITVTLHYMNASTGAQIKTTTATTTSQNNYPVPSYDSISGYDRNSAVWKTTNSASGTTYTATRLTTVTKDLYVFYSPTYSVTRHALFFKDGSFVGTAQLATESVVSGGTYTYDTASNWPNGYDYGSPKETYSFEGVYSTGNTSTGEHSGKVTGSTTINANKTIYEVFTRTTTYTLTFKPNGGSGSETTRSKIYDSPFTVPTPESLGIGPGAARVMLSWNTAQDGSGTLYKIDGTSTYTGNKAETFWLQQDFKSYEYTVDGGSSWVQMPKTTTAEGCIATYASDPSNYLPAGHIITIRGYYGSGTHSVQTINTWTGNQYESGGSHYVSIGTNNKIVLYVRNNGNFDIDVWGGSARGLVIDRGGFETKYECELNESTHDFTGTLTVLPGDKIKAYYNYATTYAITMLNYSSYGIDANGNVSVPAVYTLTLKYVSADNYPNVNVDAMVAVDTAKLIAQTFNSDMTPLCEGMEGGAAPSSLTTQWATEAGYYSKLSEATQNILKGTTPSSDADVLAMRAKYDRIVGKYKNSGASINDYMNRNPAPVGAIGGFTPFELVIGDSGDNFATIIIIIASSVSLLSITALSVLVIKKRKEKQ